MTLHTGQPLPAESTHFQVAYVLWEDTKVVYRLGQTTMDIGACDKLAKNLLEDGAVKEVFICTVHAAYDKETTVRKVI